MEFLFDVSADASNSEAKEFLALLLPVALETDANMDAGNLSIQVRRDTAEAWKTLSNGGTAYNIAVNGAGVHSLNPDVVRAIAAFRHVRLVSSVVQGNDTTVVMHTVTRC